MGINSIKGSDLNKFMTEYNNIASKDKKSPAEIIKKSMGDRFEYSNITDLMKIQADGSKLDSFRLEEYDPENSVLKMAYRNGNAYISAADPGYERFDIVLKNEDHTREDVVSRYEADILKNMFTSGLGSGVKFSEYCFNMERELTYKFSEGELIYSEYSRIRSYLDEMNKTEVYAKLNNSFGKMTLEEIADHCGSLGKRLDDIYNAGYLTKEEYDEINSELDNYTEKMAEYNERSKAFMALGAKWASSPRNAYKHYQETSKMSPEQYRKWLDEEITALVDRTYKINRDLLRNMAASVRSGV